MPSKGNRSFEGQDRPASDWNDWQKEKVPCASENFICQDLAAAETAEQQSKTASEEDSFVLNLSVF